MSRAPQTYVENRLSTFATPRSRASVPPSARPRSSRISGMLPTFANPEPAGLTVLVIDDGLSLGQEVRGALETNGAVVHVRTGSETVLDEVAYLVPAVVCLNLEGQVNAARTLLQNIRARFPSIYLVVYTDADVKIVRHTLRPDLVLSKNSPFCMALQTRCWARHLQPK